MGGLITWGFLLLTLGAVGLGMWLPLDVSLALLVLLTAMLGIFFSIGALVTAELGRDDAASAEGLPASRRKVLQGTLLSLALALPFWIRLLLLPGWVQDEAMAVYRRIVAFELEQGRPPEALRDVGGAGLPEAWRVELHYESLPPGVVSSGDRWVLWFEEPVFWSRWSLYGPKSGRWLKQGVRG